MYFSSFLKLEVGLHLVHLHYANVDFGFQDYTALGTITNIGTVP